MSDTKYPRILRAMSESPWAILPEKWLLIRDLIQFRADGGRLTHEEIRERIGERKSAEPYCVEMESGVIAANGGDAENRGVVAVMQLFGLMAHHMSDMEESSGGISVEKFTKRFQAAVNDPNIRAIVLDVDSPGGSVLGVHELAAEIFAARERKPVTAVANAVAFSAAFWIATAAGRFVVTPSGAVGSIGVFAAHQDFSEMEKMIGVKTTLVSAGKFKTEGNPFEPLSDEARAAIQKEVDEFFGMFVKAVARHRGVSVSDVRSGFGEGRMVLAAEAKRLGMVDAVSTLGQEITRLVGGGGQGKRAESDSVFSMSDVDQESADGRRVVDQTREVDVENSEREAQEKRDALADDDHRRRELELLEL